MCWCVDAPRLRTEAIKRGVRGLNYQQANSLAQVRMGVSRESWCNLLLPLSLRCTPERVAADGIKKPSHVISRTRVVYIADFYYLLRILLQLLFSYCCHYTIIPLSLMRLTVYIIRYILSRCQPQNTGRGFLPTHECGGCRREDSMKLHRAVTLQIDREIIGCEADFDCFQPSIIPEWTTCNYRYSNLGLLTHRAPISIS